VCAENQFVPSFKLVCCWHIVFAYRSEWLLFVACWQASSVFIRFVRYLQLAVVNNAQGHLLQNGLSDRDVWVSLYFNYCTVEKSTAISAKKNEKTKSRHYVEFTISCYFCCLRDSLHQGC